MTTVPKLLKEVRIALLINDAGTTRYPHAKVEFGPLSFTILKIQLKMDYIPKCKS